MRPSLLHENVNAKALLAFRLYVFGLWFVMVARDPLARLAALPESYYVPVGPLRLLPDALEAGLLSVTGLTALKIALLVLIGLSLLPRLFRYAALPAALLLIVYQALIRGFGHVNHAEIIPLLAALTLAVFAVLPERRGGAGYNPHAVPLIAVALVAAICYGMVGFFRLFQGVDIFTGDTILNFLVSRSLRTSYHDFNLGGLVATWPLAALVLKAGFPVVTLVEALAPLVLVSRLFRWVFFAVMVPFHLLTILLMEVSFVENLLLYVFFVDVARLAPGLFARPTPSPPVAGPQPGVRS
jgi:hypothetical protein